ncbi:MAG: ferritin family protein [Dissulfurimicrobium sp.]|uniref:ferritin family protein n=1 Tax=Dissulfurimicrobium TaxID=1769732 RepID=UPI001EDC1A31|nr:ferritin family protein [Dissulfurimicrobium hydrothermale]UKL12962.1 ferritin family protein [Dissulfurimicrobium hydrothermale]
MARKHNRVTDMLCAAMRMEEKELEFFRKAADNCPDGPGKEIFLAILEDETGHKKEIEEINNFLESNGGWPAACRLYEQKQIDAEKTFAKAAKKYGPSVKTATGVTEALQIGIGLEKAAMDFYAKRLDEADGQAEKAFLQKMLSEERAHHGMLIDMQYYYQDPQGYFMEKEKSGLDGA